MVKEVHIFETEKYKSNNSKKIKVDITCIDEDLHNINSCVNNTYERFKNINHNNINVEKEMLVLKKALDDHIDSFKYQPLITLCDKCHAICNKNVCPECSSDVEAYIYPIEDFQDLICFVYENERVIEIHIKNIVTDEVYEVTRKIPDDMDIYDFDFLKGYISLLLKTYNLQPEFIQPIISIILNQ